MRSSSAAFAAAAAEPIRDHDERGTLLVLRGIRALPEFRYAAARDMNGRIIAEIGQAEMLEGRDGALDAVSLASMLFAETLSVSTEVREGGRAVGSITLTAGIDGLRQRYASALLTSLLFAGGLMLLTSIVARGLIARLISPLADLAEEFADIGKRSDLKRRLAPGRRDEVGVLIEAFNEMFSQIEQRDLQLQHHLDTLEITVEERTAQLRAAKEDAEQANAAKSDFLATMSHEIRTPMNGMMVMAELLSAAPLAPKHLRYADIISRSGRSLLAIINDILDLSKIEAGSLTLEAIPFSIDAVVEDVASLFAERAREKGLTIALCVAPDVPRMVIGDPTRLSQVLSNLVNNALKFTATGGVTIEVERDDDDTASMDSARIRVNVGDTGIGIAADNLKRIFDRFSQADQTITRKFGGTGLGLSIARQLVEGMGGAISVTSEEGRGSVFTFSVTHAVAEADAEPLGLDDRRVAICATDPLVETSVGKMLTKRGAILVPANDRPDIVLMQAGADPSPELPENAPILLMRPFAMSGATPRHIPVAGEIDLPLSRADLDTVAQALHFNDWKLFQAQVHLQQEREALPDLGHLHVLAVDDTAVNRVVLDEALRGFGIKAEMAESGSDAIAKSKKQAFDVIFMDCSMPDMDGFTATASIRQHERETRQTPAFIVALTAHVTGPDASRWQEAGMDAYVAKPFTITQLLDVFKSRDARGDSVSPGLERRELGEKGATAESLWWKVPLLEPDTLAMFGAMPSQNGQTLMAKVFGLFCNHAPGAYSALAAASDRGGDDGAKLAHALRSMCLSAGASRAAAICQAIEESFKKGEPLPAHHLPALHAAIRETDGAMKAALIPADTTMLQAIEEQA
ncbi:ATP-binding protein [Mesorhizobium sp. RP14(2022)]|uniref:histidine kinase n=1 Tax=Mesorhizobium liriopis TaxID=2953882 RepID=A0ABT1C9K7_9HYPH|nr:hybrid sensor histidine kinase/response regulator [Mesorhizobium liriopis]MCO6051527.1 ATP-binding protein [Mesorhizobium liriopis]